MRVTFSSINTDVPIYTKGSSNNYMRKYFLVLHSKKHALFNAISHLTSLLLSVFDTLMQIIIFRMPLSKETSYL